MRLQGTELQASNAAGTRLLGPVPGKNLTSFCRETAKKPTVAIWASPYDMTQSLVS